MAGGIGKLGIPNRETVESNIIVMRNAGSYILAQELQAKKSELWDIACIFVKLYTRTDNKDWLWKIPFRNSVMRIIAV